jgi:hypothetical protein
MAKARRSTSKGRKSGAAKASGGGAGPLRTALVLIAVAALFGAALYGLFRVDASGPAAPRPAAGGAPPVDHIDDASRDALEQILREEGGG